MFDWNDARYLVAVAETGSTLSAGRALGVSQTTVARRIAALEDALGLALFERRRAGYRPTVAGGLLLAHAQTLAGSAEALADAAAALRRETGGVVRLTAGEPIAVSVLPAMLRALHDAHPDIVIELDATDAVRDLGIGAADIAIRVAKEVSGGGVVGRRIGEDRWTVYCSRAYADAHGVPRNRREMAAHPLIAGGGGRIGSYYGHWLRDNGLEQAVAMTHGSVTGVLAAVRSGMGCAALPCMVAATAPELIQCLPASPHGMDMWLLTHERVRHAPRVRAVIDHLDTHLRRHLRTVDDELARFDAARAAVIERSRG